MTILVRPVALDVEREALCELLECNLKDLAHRQRFDWLYCRNPAGEAWSWFACDPSIGRPVGVASLFPRAIWLGEKMARCGQVGDFAVDIAYRSLGPAIMLQRATLGPVDCGDVAFCYDAPPHEAGMAPFRRLGLAPTCQITRYVLLLRTERQLEKRFARPISTSLARAGNAFLALRRRPAPSTCEIDITLHNGRFTQEFSTLDQQARQPDLLRSRRSAEDLNWRYRDDPLHSYEVLTARRHGDLIGFAVTSWKEQDLYLVDLFAVDEGEVASALLDGLVGRAIARSAQTVQTLAPETHGLSRLLREHGFRARGNAAQMVAYARPGSEAANFLNQSFGWLLRPVDLLA